MWLPHTPTSSFSDRGYSPCGMLDYFPLVTRANYLQQANEHSNVQQAECEQQQLLAAQRAAQAVQEQRVDVKNRVQRFRERVKRERELGIRPKPGKRLDQLIRAVLSESESNSDNTVVCIRPASIVSAQLAELSRPYRQFRRDGQPARKCRVVAVAQHINWQAPFLWQQIVTVNSDETQLLLQHGGNCTYAPTGSRQVDVIGKEEKRACTIMTSLSMDGTMLPFQSIWKGSSNRSLPFSNDTRHPTLAEAYRQGHIFTPSCSSTYWTNFGTLKIFVTDLLVPYLHAASVQHGRDRKARCLWVIDVYSVHRSQEFRDWMRAEHSWILLQYVPAGCTGVWQPADVGLQQRLKRHIRQSALADVATEILVQLQDDVPPSAVVLDTSLPTLRNRTVPWLLKALADLNQPEIVRDAWRLCNSEVDDDRFSYQCLTGNDMRQHLQALPFDDHALFLEILPYQAQDDVPAAGESVEEDEIPAQDADADLGEEECADECILPEDAGGEQPDAEAEVPEGDRPRCRAAKNLYDRAWWMENA